MKPEQNKSKVLKMNYQGQSMSPLFQEKDILIVEFFSSEMERYDLDEGDLVLHKDLHEMMAHRLTNTDSFKTESDWGLGHWNQVTPLGKVLGIQRGETVYFWGPRGHVLKGLYCYLSKKTRSDRRLVRWVSKIILKAITPVVLYKTRIEK